MGRVGGAPPLQEAMEPTPLRPPPPRRTVRAVLVLALLALAAVAAWWWLMPGRTAQPTAGTAPPPTVATAPAAAPSVPAEPDPPAPEQPLDEAGLLPALEALVGHDAVARLIQASGLPQRIVATVDNLARSSAPASMWPVQPAAGRFSVVQAAEGGERIAPANAQRYEPLVALAERVDPRLLADWYRRALPLLQPAYEQLGYPGQRFHARLVQVLDHLLATPPAPAAAAVRLTEVRGPEPSTRPWVRYEFADPALEQASAGRKILWRVGPENQQRLMKVLAAFREQIRTTPR